MAVTSLDIIKSWFKRGLKPTEAQFANTWDSYWHKLESISMSAIDGLNIALSNKANVNHGHEASDISGLEEILLPLQEEVADLSGRMDSAETAIAGKADIEHTHQTSEVEGLKEVLQPLTEAVADHETRIAALEEAPDVVPVANYLLELDTAPTYASGRVKIMKYRYVSDSANKYEERFSYDANGRISFVELKDDVSAKWIRRTYSYSTAGELQLPAVADIVAWTIS